MNRMEKLPSPEAQESRGKNIEVRVHCIRHGEKEVVKGNPETGLSEIGRQQSRNWGQEKLQQPVLKTYSSDTARTRETAQLIIGEAHAGKKMTHRVKDELSFRYDPQGEFARQILATRQAIFGNDFAQAPRPEQERRRAANSAAQLNNYIAYGDHRPDPNTYSPVETAAALAKRVDIFRRMAPRLRSDSQVDLINITHEFNLAAFLHEVILRPKEDGTTQRGFDDVKDIGGPFESTEGFEIIVKTDGNSQLATSLLLRGKEYEIDDDRLRELANFTSQGEQPVP